MRHVSVVIPAFNEEASIENVLRSIRRELDEGEIESELIVVVDGATDNTASRAAAACDRVICHPTNLGYGRSLKTGISAARHELIAITDADETYPSDRLPELIALTDQFHMVVGARTGTYYRGSPIKRVGRWVFKQLSEFAAGQRIADINSGMRVFRKSQIVPFFPVISSGFSFTTTSTLVFLLNGLLVHYVPIEYHERTGQSKVRHLHDSLRALQIISEAILRCNPIKMFLLLAAPMISLSFIAGLVAIGSGNPIWILISSLFLCVGVLVFSLGCLAVTVVHRQPRLSEVEQWSSVGIEHGDIPQEPTTDAHS